MNSLLNYPSNAVRRALEAEGKNYDKDVNIGQDFLDGIDWGHTDKDINYDDPKERERFENTVKTAVGRALVDDEPNYELPQAYRDEIWKNLQHYGPIMKEQYEKYRKFDNSLTPEQRKETYKKVRMYAKKHVKGMIED